MKLIHNPYHKKIDRSTFEWGIIIPKEYEQNFLFGKPIKPGSSRSYKIKFAKKKYNAKLYHVNRTGFNNVYQLRWDIDKDFMNLLRKEFINSYVILKSQKELFDSSVKSQKKFRGKMEAGNQEVLTLRPVSSDEIHAEPFIQIKSQWNALFERLAEANVFGWLFSKKSNYLIAHSSGWHPISEFKYYTHHVNVIYYLANSKKKHLYIGKADIFGNRVKPGREHQGMAGDWDKFRFDVIKPEFASMLERIEDHTIRSFAAVLQNLKSFQSLEIGNYTLVNKNWKKL